MTEPLGAPPAHVGTRAGFYAIHPSSNPFTAGMATIGDEVHAENMDCSDVFVDVPLPEAAARLSQPQKHLLSPSAISPGAAGGPPHPDNRVSGEFSKPAARTYAPTRHQDAVQTVYQTTTGANTNRSIPRNRLSTWWSRADWVRRTILVSAITIVVLVIVLSVSITQTEGRGSGKNGSTSGGGGSSGLNGGGSGGSGTGPNVTYSGTASSLIPHPSLVPSA